MTDQPMDPAEIIPTNRPGRKVGDVTTAHTHDPRHVDERQRGSTVSQLEGGLGPDDLATTPEEMARERERFAPPGQTSEIDEKESTGLGTGRKGMFRADGKVAEGGADFERPSSFPEKCPEPPHKHPESY